MAAFESLNFGMQNVKGLYWERQTGNPKNIVGV